MELTLCFASMCCRSLQDMYGHLGLHVFDYTPTTFLVKSSHRRDEVQC